MTGRSMNSRTLILALLAAAACGRSDDMHDDRFSAYALSNTTLRGSFALSRASAIDAEKQALSACESAAGDGFPCRQILWFTKGCGAVALGARPRTDVTDWIEASRNGELLQVGNGVGPDAASACADAVAICVNAGGINCGAREVACMDTGVVSACPSSGAGAMRRRKDAATAAPTVYVGYAFSKEARSGAFAFSRSALADARDSALAECGTGGVEGCEALGAFEAACGATAVGGGEVALAPGATARTACAAALAACERVSGSCSGLTYACSSGEPGFCKEF